MIVTARIVVGTSDPGTPGPDRTLILEKAPSYGAAIILVSMKGAEIRVRIGELKAAVLALAAMAEP